jgi:hypothetical protein
MDSQDYGADPNFGMTSEHQCYVFRARGPVLDERLHGFIMGGKFYPAAYEHETDCWYSTVALTRDEVDVYCQQKRFVALSGGKFEDFPLASA